MQLPNFRNEKTLWRKKYLVIGVDEVGRGAIAGPVVAAAVTFGPAQIKNLGIRIDDSKRLTEKQREKASKWIKKNCLGWAVGEASASYINRYGIVKATHKAFRIAIKKLIDNYARVRPLHKAFLLTDAFHIKYVKGIGLKNQKAIIHGDQKSVSIASASIIAKVYRDNLMRKLHKKHRKYLWYKNKGYGTKKHLMSVATYGITLFHRKLFLRQWLTNIQ